MRNRLSNIYNSQTKVIRAELRNAISKIHITYDLWTSPSRHAILAASLRTFSIIKVINSSGFLQ
jgi:hypothetical protein